MLLSWLRRVRAGRGSAWSYFFRGLECRRGFSFVSILVIKYIRRLFIPALEFGQSHFYGQVVAILSAKSVSVVHF